MNYFEIKKQIKSLEANYSDIESDIQNLKNDLSRVEEKIEKLNENLKTANTNDVVGATVSYRGVAAVIETANAIPAPKFEISYTNVCGKKINITVGIREFNEFVFDDPNLNERFNSGQD